MTEIIWRQWDDEAFAEARALDRPILLDIGAVWCHWCHVMDRGIEGDPLHTGTYNDPRVVELVTNRYVPIKVDTDRRPDINARYNRGGWPSTVFLTPAGEPIYGETYVTPERMVSLLAYVADSYRDRKEAMTADIAARVRENARPGPPVLSAASLPAGAELKASAAIVAAYDEEFGGFGVEPKFPHVQALRFALDRAVFAGDEAMANILIRTLKAMAGGGMYDMYAGGFFRYSTTRDWTIPHFEKMLEDNAQLSRLCYLAGCLLGDADLVKIGDDVHRWLFEVMRDPQTACFAGSQDADRELEYYGLPLDERAKLPTPFIDRTLYADWNALMVSSLCARYRAGADAAILDAAVTAFDFVERRILPRHYFADGSPGGPKLLLMDYARSVEAAVDLFQVTGDVAYLERGIAIADEILANLTEPSGAFGDVPVSEAAQGPMGRANVDFGQNSEAALALVLLAKAGAGDRYRDAAIGALSVFAGDYERWGLFSTGYALAAAEIGRPAARVVLVGDIDDPRMAPLRSAAMISPAASRIEMGGASDGIDYPPDPSGAPLAYTCVGPECLAPARTAEELAYRLMDASRRERV